MNGIQKNAATKGLAAKITAITGWRIPEDNIDYETAFTDQLTKFVHENCADLTLSELEYSLRKYGVDMSDWGRPMHLGLIADCVGKYRAFRLRVSEIEEQSVEGKLLGQKQGKSEELHAGPVDWSKEWDKVVYGAKIGQIKNVFIATDLYNWLIETEKMPVPDDKAKWGIVKFCAARYLETISDQLLSGTGAEQPYELKRRIALLANTGRPIWKKDTAIMTTLITLAKIETVGRLAVETAKLLPNEDQNIKVALL